MKNRAIPILLMAGSLSAPAHTLKCQQPTDIDPVSVSPDKYKVLLENDRMRVVEYSIKPGERDQPHTHPPKISYVVSGGSLRITLGDTSFISNDSTGEVSWRGRVPRHFAENVGTTSIRILLFEVKRVDGEAASPKEDPALVNGSELTIRLENDSVRVMEGVIPPGFKEKLHTHPPYATYVIDGGTVRLHMTDGTTRDAELKAGQVLFSERLTHWAENIGAVPIRLILVELRRR